MDRSAGMTEGFHHTNYGPGTCGARAGVRPGEGRGPGHTAAVPGRRCQGRRCSDPAAGVLATSGGALLRALLLVSALDLPDIAAMRESTCGGGR
jgi:hypothetical protein